MSRLFLAMAVAAAMGLFIVPAKAQNADNGQKVYRQQCNICHDVAAGKNRIGPTLFGVVGRKSGTEAGYTFSDPMKASGLTWDAATLDRYLTDPRAVVAGTKMTYAGLKNDEQRKDLIAYLSTVH